MEEQPSEITPVEALPPQPQEDVQQPTNNRKKLVIIGAIIIVAAIVAGLAYWKLSQTKPVATPVKKSVVTTTAPVVKSTGVYETAKQLTDLALFPHIGEECKSLGNTDCPSPSGVKYFEVGTRTDGTKLIAITAPSEGPNFIGYDTYVGTVAANGHVTLYGTNTDQAASFIDKTKVTLSKTGYPAELIFPKNATINDQPVKRLVEDDTYASFFLSSDYKVKEVSRKKLASIGRDFYDVTKFSYDNFDVHEISARITNSFESAYELAGNLSDTSGTPAITWKSGETNTDGFTPSGPGCGSATGFMVLKNVDTGSFITAGTDAHGGTVYQLPTSNAFFQEVFTKDYANGDYLDGKYKNLTKDQFQAAHGVIVSKNGLGQYVAYLNSTLIQGGGCAKPVVYLYPNKTTDVAVRVGAAVTKSDPYYNQSTGWQHVTAQPSGALTYQGKSYGSLFWEGLGFGAYPNITSGTVVPSASAVSTIKQQLAAQGLNAQETSDFLAYWQPKLPTTPFVRLSWLTTEQLNTLAPLQITPAPQTVIRTFLDFQGLSLPIAIPAQHFSTPARTGFTVVEWGGLLRQ